MFLKTCDYASPLTYRRAQRPLWISWVVINWIKSRPPHTLLEYINMNARSLSSCFHFLLCHHFWGEDDHLESLQAPKLMWDWTLWLIFLVALYMFNVLNNLICYMFQFIHFASFFQCPTIFWWVWNIWCIPLQQQMIRDKPANQEEDVTTARLLIKLSNLFNLTPNLTNLNSWLITKITISPNKSHCSHLWNNRTVGGRRIKVFLLLLLIHLLILIRKAFQEDFCCIENIIRLRTDLAR